MDRRRITRERGLRQLQDKYVNSPQIGWVKNSQKETSMCAAPHCVPALRHTDQDGVIALQMSLKAWPLHHSTEYFNFGLLLRYGADNAIP